jgi:hypothetical protein
MWRIPYAYALKVAASVLRSPYGILLKPFEQALSRCTFVHTEVETGGS